MCFLSNQAKASTVYITSDAKESVLLTCQRVHKNVLFEVLQLYTLYITSDFIGIVSFPKYTVINAKEVVL